MKPGDRVICIDDVGTAPNMGLAPELVEGREYTIAWAGRFIDPFYEGEYEGVNLVEVKRGEDPVSGVKDKPFAARRFVPVVTWRNVRELAHEYD